MYQWDEHIDFNRYTNLDSIEGRILEGLIKSQTVHAMRLWDILGNDDMNCLNSKFTKQQIQNNPSLKNFPTSQYLLSNLSDTEAWKQEYDRRRKMVYRGVGVSNDDKVFLSPYSNDAWTAESSRLDIFVDDIIPKNHITSTVLVGVELIVHNKIVNIYSDADEFNEKTNPSEMVSVVNDEGEEVLEPLIRIKSRPVTLLKSALAELNGVFVAGIGELQLNTTMNTKCGVKREIWNNRAYLGYSVIFATLMSGVSDNPEYAY